MMRAACLHPDANPLLAALEAALNALLRHDPETLRALAALEGQAIAIEMRAPALRLFVLPGPGGLRLTTAEPERTGVTVSGHAVDLLGTLAPGGSPIGQGHVEVRGDIHLAQRLQAILRGVDIDWEDWLAAYVGDLPAHKLGRLGRDLRAYLRAAGGSLIADLTDYLHHERRWLPVRDEVEEFARAVDRLRDDVERAQQRLRRLEQRRREDA